MLNSHSIVLVNKQHHRRFMMFWKTNMVAVTTFENALYILLEGWNMLVTHKTAWGLNILSFQFSQKSSNKL